MRLPILLCATTAIAVLAGCAGTPGPKVSSAASKAAPAPAPAAVPSPWIRNTQGKVVTLADLTSGNPIVGQSEALAASTPGATAMEAASSSSASDDFDNLEIVGGGLKGKLAVLRVGSNRNDSDVLSVFAGLKNETGRKLELELQTIYRDRDGHSLSDGEGSWIPVTLKPHEQTQYRSVALSQDATDFVVRIRPAASSPSGR
jgi:hypothetical protein